jgi:uncharacterized lipoprotein YmbA
MTGGPPSTRQPGDTMKLRSLSDGAARLRVPTLLALALLAGCSSAPPVQLYQLRAATPVSAPAVAPTALNWQLMLPVKVPDYLDRDAVVVPQGQSGLQAQAGHRWAEPLREAVPRLLRQDLGTLLGEGRVWLAPLPPGLVIARQLRVELLALEASADRRAVDLRARWTVAVPGGAAAPQVDTVALSVPAAGTDVDSLVAAHRLALWRLAERIAAVAPAP